MELARAAGEETRPTFTNSELRYVFRQWTELRHVVHFFLAFREVGAPWEDDVVDSTTGKATRAPWDESAAARRAKYGGVVARKPLV